MNVIIVDDHPLVRKGLHSMFSFTNTFEVIGEATNKTEALLLLSSVQSDLAIVDLRLGLDSGLDVIEESKQQGIACKFVILTSSTDEADFNRAKNIGVDGYLLKEAFPEELLHALKVIKKGRKYYDPGVLELFTQTDDSKNKKQQINYLTPKEKEVLTVLGMGLSNREISQTLFITEYTVKKHVSQVLSKLELADRTHAALYANATGLATYVVN